MNFYGKSGSSAFVVENFNGKPPQWTPGRELPNKMSLNPSQEWMSNKRQMQSQIMSNNNPFSYKNVEDSNHQAGAPKRLKSSVSHPNSLLPTYSKFQ